MAKYANKTCYDCGIQNPANLMERVTESYNSGRSDRRPDGVNVAAFLLSDAATSRKMIKGAVTKNNRRSYTRNRTVWKCLDCSGHNALVAHERAVRQAKQSGAIKLGETSFAILTAPAYLWFVFFLLAAAVDWVLLHNEPFSSGFYWINGIGSFVSCMVAGYYQNERDDAIKASTR